MRSIRFSRSYYFESAIEFSASFEDPFGHVEVHHERLLTGNELGKPVADCRDRRQWVFWSQPLFSEAVRQKLMSAMERNVDRQAAFC